MARRRGDDLAVSLFPFLSVLACVIGTLTLLLAAIAVGSMGGRSIEQIELSERHQASLSFLAGAVAVLEELEAQLSRLEERARDQEELGERLHGLGLSPDISLEELEGIAKAREQLEEMRQRRGALERRQRALATALASEEKKLEAKEARQLRAPIIIDPSGIGREQRPYLVECSADFLELYHATGDWSFRIERDHLANSPDYVRYLKRLAAIRQSLLVFMIRPDGVETFWDAKRIADRYSVRYAKLPLPGEGELDFGLLRGGAS